MLSIKKGSMFCFYLSELCRDIVVNYFCVGDLFIMMAGVREIKKRLWLFDSAKQ